MKHTLPLMNIQATSTGSSFEYDGKRYDISMRGEHQTANAALAIETIQYLIQRKQYRVEQRHILQGLKKAFWPGRLEELTPGILIDGAHNIEGIQTLVDYLTTIDQPIHVIYACLEKKPYAVMVAMLEPVASKFTFTSFDDPGCLDPEVLFQTSKHVNKEVVTDIKPYFIPEDGMLRIFCGSLYFISELRQQYFSK
jgi:dihydrofolate synthase/folylpolyglutamate synthase